MATLKRGLKNIYAALVTKDDATGYTAGTPFYLIPAGTMSRTTSQDTTRVYFDDAVFAQIGTNGATTITIEGASLSEIELSKILPGRTTDVSTSAILDSGDFSEKYVALIGETEAINGVSEYFCFLKGTFAEPDRNDKTKDESTDTNGLTLVYTAIPTMFEFGGSGRQKKVVVYSDYTSFKSGQSWFAQVVTPANLSTICVASNPIKYDLSINEDSHVASLSVVRDGTPVTEGIDVLDYGDVLTITASADPSYEIDKVFVNDTEIENGSTWTVTGTTAIFATAKEEA